MSTLEDRRHDAQQDRISDDRHNLALRRAQADPAAVASQFFTSLESGHVTTSTDGGFLFDTEDGLTVEVIFDSVRAPDSIEASLWADDIHGDPVQMATVLLTASVIA